MLISILNSGVKSTLGRIFGSKKEKLKSIRNDGGGFLEHRQGSPYVTAPLSNSPSGSFTPVQVMQLQQQQQMHYSNAQQMMQQSSYPGSLPQQQNISDCDIPTSDSMAGGLGSIAGKGDFDRRRKKKYVRFN